MSEYPSPRYEYFNADAALAQLRGDRGALRLLAVAYATELPAHLAVLREGNALALRQLLHQLRATFAILHCAKGQQVSQQLHTHLANPDYLPVDERDILATIMLELNRELAHFCQCEGA